jgi:hypothetical protein
MLTQTELLDQEEQALLEQLQNIRKKKQINLLTNKINDLENDIKKTNQSIYDLQNQLADLQSYKVQKVKEVKLLNQQLQELEPPIHNVEVEPDEEVEEVVEDEQQSDIEFMETLKQTIMRIQENLIHDNIIVGPKQKPRLAYMKMVNSKTSGYDGTVQVGNYIVTNVLPSHIFDRYYKIYSRPEIKSNTKRWHIYILGSESVEHYFDEMIARL